MKKIIMLCLVMVLVFTSASVCFAAISPGASPVGAVVSKVSGNGNVAKTTTDAGDIQLVAKAAEGETFSGWTIKGAKGEALTANVDYKIVTGDLNSTTIVIKALTAGVDVVVTANFTNNANAKPGGSTSPSTADNAIVYIAAIVLACGAAVVGKKALCR